MSPDTQLCLVMLIVILVAAWLFFWPPTSASNLMEDPEHKRVGENLEKTRRLFGENNFLQKAAITEDIMGYKGAYESCQRVHTNINQITRNIHTLYGSEASNEISTILHQRHDIIQNMAKLAHQNKDIEGEYTKLQDNTRDLVALYTRINPHLDETKINNLLSAQAEHQYKQINHIAKHESIAAMSEFDALNKNLGEFLDEMDRCTWKHLTGTHHKYR